jgi:hypothetical protein
MVRTLRVSDYWILVVLCAGAVFLARLNQEKTNPRVMRNMCFKHGCALELPSPVVYSVSSASLFCIAEPTMMGCGVATRCIFPMFRNIELTK